MLRDFQPLLAPLSQGKSGREWYQCLSSGSFSGWLNSIKELSLGMGRAGENDSGVSDMFIAVFYWFLLRGESYRYSTQLQSKLISLLFKKFWHGLPWWLLETLHCTWFGGVRCTIGTFSPVFGSKESPNRSSVCEYTDLTETADVLSFFHAWLENPENSENGLTNTLCHQHWENLQMSTAFLLFFLFFVVVFLWFIFCWFLKRLLSEH